MVVILVATFLFVLNKNQLISPTFISRVTFSKLSFHICEMGVIIYHGFVKIK